MKTLTKVKLINWHTFINEEIPVYHNALITGENGTGKSTILDALQYVLTVGKCKFNKAASDIGTRTLESYMRAKTGVEGNEYLRSGDVTTYIALEFYDEKDRSFQVIGVVIDLPAGGRKNEEFFQAVNTKLSDILFIKNNKVLTRREFKDTVNNNVIFKDTKKNAQDLFANALRVNVKYFDLVTRALAFKAIDNVYQFIMDFLLKDDPIVIENLRQSIHDYQRLEEKLKVSEEECQFLDIIIDTYKEYEKNNTNLDVLKYIKDKINEQELIYEINNYKEKLNQAEFNCKQYSNKQSRVENDLQNCVKQLNELNQDMNAFESYRLKQKFSDDLEYVKKDKNKNEKSYKQTIEDLKNEASLIKKLRIKKNFLDYIYNGQYNTDELYQYMKDIVDYIQEKNNEAQHERILLEESLKNDEKELGDLNRKFNLLKDNKALYVVEVKELISILEEKLFEHYGKHVDVKPLCEYLEIKDENWRNAVEGYLNTQRFDIILDPQYFDYASNVYNEYKERKGIYGVGIVNVAKLKKYDDVVIDGTLANQIKAKNTYAKWYANMLLSKVITCDNVIELKNYPISITKECMLYKNYTVRAIRPKIYATPFIGLGAIRIQKEQIEVKINEIKKIINEKSSHLQNILSHMNLYKESKADYILHRLSIIDEYQDIVKKYKELKKQIDELKIDDSIIALEEQYNRLNTKRTELEYKKQEYYKEVVLCENNIKTFIENIDKNTKYYEDIHNIVIVKENENIEISRKGNELVNKYIKKYNHNFDGINNNIFVREKEYLSKKQYLSNTIIMKMNEYNNLFNVGYENSIECIDQYQVRYHNLRDMDIVAQKERTRQARLKCEESFKTSFISGLKDKIDNARKEISNLNKGLAKRDFNGETYEFSINPTTKEYFRDYYKIIQNGVDYHSNDLLSESLDESQRKIMDELFVKLAGTNNDKQTEKMLMEYTDYRNYLDYDIKIKYDNGTYAYFSKVNKEKSGGETQTPFYVIMAASFEQVIANKSNDEDFGCVVILDEAFNNMDEHRIQEMIKFYNEREIQTFIAVPPSRASTIIPYVNTRLLVIKHNGHSFVEVVKDEEL